MGWDPVTADDAPLIPLPNRLAIRPDFGIVGRTAEMAAMQEALKRVTAGEGREVVLVSGEPGQGKTTIVAEVARSAVRTGGCVLAGYCERDLTVPYRLFREALSHYIVHASEERLRTHVADHGSELVRLAPALASRIPDLPATKATDSDSERYLVFAAVVGLLSVASDAQPVVLIVDDLQWADTASLELLRHVLASDALSRVLVLATYRDSETFSSGSLVDTLAELRRLPGVSRIELAGLDMTGVVALLEAGAGHPVGEDGSSLARAIYRETDGNPFFATEVLRNLAESGAIRQDAGGRWVTESALDMTSLPDSVREVITARVFRLGADALGVLSVASVIGRDFDVALLARCTNSNEDDLLDLLDAAASVALVREGVETERHSFSHGLIQRTLYEGLGHLRRARVHRQVAEALEELCGSRPGERVAELARHWMSAAPADVVKAIDYSRQAGDAALAALAPADAVHHYSQAIDLLAEYDDADPTLSLDVAIGLGIAQRQIGDSEFRRTLLEAAHRAAKAGDTARLVAAAVANNRGFGMMDVVDDDKVAVLELALDRTLDDDPARALLLATLTAESPVSRSLEERAVVAEEAIAAAVATDDDVTLVRVLNLIALPLRVPQFLELSVARATTSLDRAKAVGDPILLFEAAALRRVTAAQAGDVDEVDRCIELTGSLAERLDQPIVNWVYFIEQATGALMAGDPDRAEQLAAEAHEIGTRMGQPDAGSIFSAQFLEACWQRGILEELIPLLEVEVDARPGLTAVSAGLAVAHAEAGAIEASRGLIEDAANPTWDEPLTGSWLVTMTLCSEVAILSRDSKLAGTLFARLLPWSDQVSAHGLTAEGPVSHYLGGLASVQGRFDEADALFGRANAFNARAGAKFFGARTNLQWGVLLAMRRAPGDSQKARALLDDAHGAATAHGYTKVALHASVALQNLPETDRP